MALEENPGAFPCGRGAEERAQPRRCFRWSPASCGGSGSALPVLLEKWWQCGEGATGWDRGNIPLQLNGIVMSPQGEAQPACSSGARRGAGNTILELAAGGAEPVGFGCGPYLEDTLCAPMKSR